jgi:carbamoyl-phosphate synthase small subunit
MAVEGVDTPALTRHICLRGALRAVLSTEDLDRNRLTEKAKNSLGLIGRDLVKEVTCQEPYEWNQTVDPSLSAHRPPAFPEEFTWRVVVLDFGVKYNILHSLQEHGCHVVVTRAFASTESILSYQPDGIVLSNGPGDPEGVPYAIKTVHQLLGKKPLLGICLGHQLLGLALGGRTFKLKFGHRGANQPVMDLKTKKVSITSQNHGFCVDPQSLDPEEVELTQVNLNDQTSEGMRHKTLPIVSVQYHPEASPGPHDTGALFEEFIRLMERYHHA